MQPPTSPHTHTSTGVPCDEQTVAFGGKLLEDGSVLAQAGVSDEQTLYVLMRLLGGAKKRKKKTYTKPKKQKHKHKKIKLRVLQFYKVLGGMCCITHPGHPLIKKHLCTTTTRHTVNHHHHDSGGGRRQGPAPAQDLPRLRAWHLHGHHV